MLPKMPQAPGMAQSPMPPPVFGDQPQAKPQKRKAQPTVVGSAPEPENLGSKTLIGQ